MNDPMVRFVLLARPLRGRLVLAVLAGAATTAAGIGLLSTSGYLIARASQHPNVAALSVAVVAVRALGIGRGAFRYLERLLTHDVAFRVLGEVRVRIYRKLVPLRGYRPGDLLARLVSDIDSVQDVFVRGLVPPLSAFAAGGAAVILCTALLLPGGAALGGGLLLAGVALPWLSVVLTRRAGRRTAPVRARMAAATVDAACGAAELLAYGADERALARLRATDTELLTQARRGATVRGLGTGLAALATGATVWAVLLTGVLAHQPRVSLAVMVLTAMAAFEVTSGLPAAAAQLTDARPAARRVTAILDAEDPMPAPADPLPPPARPVTVRLRDARLRYEPGGPWALDGLDLDLTPGRRIALVGPSGAGKSTVAAVLFRFRDLDAGTATLNDADLTAYDPAHVRRLISGVPQDPHVFATTIAANLRLARPDATHEQLRAAADRARLLTWIESLPSGWDTHLGEHGTALSGGERQRLALARAFLADADVLILDEPTAHLDPPTRAALTTDLLQTTRDRTTLLITHDLTGLATDELDEIIVLDHGRARQRGTHDELLREPGTYRRLWERS